MRVSAALPTGVTALFFDSVRQRRELEARLVERLESNDFSEVILPVVDYVDPYQELLSRGSRQELYRFIDRDGETLALRSDFTPMLARLIAPRLVSLELPLKFFYRGDVLRYQEERAALQREFFQVGAEVLDTDGERAERTALEQFLELLTAGGRRRLLVVLGIAGALDGLILENRPRDDLHSVLRAILRRERAGARQLGPAFLEVVEKGVPEDPRILGDGAAERVERLRAWCEELAEAFPQIKFQIDLAEFGDQVLAPELRRDLGPRAYYDGVIFRAFGGVEAMPLGGGGRYDRLFQSLGADVAAAGFSVSVDLLAGHAQVPGRSEE